MKILAPLLAAAVIATATGAGAQTLEKSVGEALKRDGGILSAIPAEKAIAETQNAEFRAERGGPGGGRGGDHRGGDHRGGDRGGDHRGGDRGGDHRGGDRGGDHRGGDHRGEPGRHEPGRDHRDWGRWHGHPGWGRHHDRWDWDGYGRPHWWGWVIFPGGSRLACYEHYDALLRNCNDNCQIENNECVQSCSVFGDPYCAEQCSVNGSYCFSECREDHDLRTARCPY